MNGITELKENFFRIREKVEGPSCLADKTIADIEGARGEFLSLNVNLVYRLIGLAKCASTAEERDFFLEQARELFDHARVVADTKATRGQLMYKYVTLTSMSHAIEWAELKLHGPT